MKVIVIGGGVVGASAAYTLACGGVEVTLIDRADEGYATAAGAGIVSPGISARTEEASLPLAAAAVAYYPQLLQRLAEDGEQETGYEVVGGLFVATDQREAAELPMLLSRIERRRQSGVGNLGAVSLISGREATKLFPALADVPGAIDVPDVARVNGRLLRGALQRAAQKRGATVVTGSATPLRRGDRVAGVQVAGQNLAADAVLLAGGAWSNELGAALGVNLPIYPQRGQILHLDLPDTDTSRWPIIVGFHSHYILTFPPSRVVCGATRESASGYDVRTRVGGIHEVTGEALRVAPGLAAGTLHEVRVGLRPASPDGRPILGRIPGIKNCYVATGHGPEGLTLGPYSGAAVADLLQGKEAAIDLSLYTPDRFQSTMEPGERRGSQ